MSANQIPIRNAADTLLSANPGTLPNVSDALFDWFQPILATQIVKTQVNYQTIEAGVPRRFQGVIQPFSGREIQMKPEGQRSWDWVWLHCFPNITFEPDDQVWIGNRVYRVMKLNDYSKYGYLLYELQSDFQDRSTAPPLPSEDDIAKFVEVLTFSAGGELQTVDVSADIPDAQDAIWKLYDVDHGNTLCIGAIQVVDATSIAVTAPGAGNFRVVGAY